MPSSLSNLFRGGRTVIVDLRDEWIEKEEALVLFIVLMRIFARARGDGTPFNRLVIFDEAHKYFGDSDMITEVVETIREARHHGTSVVIASQDPLSIPRSVIELSSTLILHRFTSPLWLKHLKGAVSSLEAVTDQDVGTLKPGEALVWAQRCTEPRFTEAPQKVWMRTRVTKHGGATRVAGANPIDGV
jgi:DNA helicase HerA-like ATPase